MESLDKVKKYTDTVCEQVRWKKCHRMISKELTCHIIDQKNDFLLEGFDESTSIDKAIQEMGDPVLTGIQMDRTHKPKTEWSIIITAAILVTVGVVLGFSLNDPLPSQPESFFAYKIIFITLSGIIFMSFSYFTDFTAISEHPMINSSLLFVLLAALKLFATEFNGADTWLYVPPLGRFDLSGLSLLFPTAYTSIIYTSRDQGYQGLIKCIFALSVSALFLYFIMSEGYSFIFQYSLTCLLLLTFSIGNGWFAIKRLHGFSLVLISFTFILVSMSSYIQDNLIALFHLSHLKNVDGSITVITNMVLKGSRFFGQGSFPMKGHLQLSWYLPSVNTDYLLIYSIHRLGWFLPLMVIVLFFSFIVRGFYLCSRQKNFLGKLVSMSVLLTLSIQAIAYILGNLGFEMFQIVSLPFISSGTLAAIANFILLGTMLSIFKTGNLAYDRQKSCE